MSSGKAPLPACAITWTASAYILRIAQQAPVSARYSARASPGDCSGTLRISSRASFILPWRASSDAAPCLHLERPLRVVDAREPALGADEIPLLLGRLREQEVAPGSTRVLALGGRVVLVVAAHACAGVAAAPKFTAAPPSTRRT